MNVGYRLHYSLVNKLTNNAILFNIANMSYNYIKLINTTLSLINSIGESKFSWACSVAHENLT